MSALRPKVSNPGRFDHRPAILNMSREDIEKVCQRGSEKGIVQAANFNSPGQIVISGETEAVYYAMEIAKNLGARKVVGLNVYNLI